MMRQCCALSVSTVFLSAPEITHKPLLDLDYNIIITTIFHFYIALPDVHIFISPVVQLCSVLSAESLIVINKWHNMAKSLSLRTRPGPRQSHD